MDISGNMVTVTVSGDMMGSDEIIVKFFNVMVQVVASRDAEDLQAQLMSKRQYRGTGH